MNLKLVILESIIKSNFYQKYIYALNKNKMVKVGLYMWFVYVICYDSALWMTFSINQPTTGPVSWNKRASPGLWFRAGFVFCVHSSLGNWGGEEKLARQDSGTPGSWDPGLENPKVSNFTLIWGPSLAHCGQQMRQTISSVRHAEAHSRQVKLKAF